MKPRTTDALNLGQPSASSIATVSSSEIGGSPGVPRTRAVAGSSKCSIACVYGTSNSTCTSRAIPTIDMQSGRLAVM